MAILAKGLLLFLTVSSIYAQYHSSNYHTNSRLSGFNPIIVGQPQEDSETLEGKYRPRYVQHPRNSQKDRIRPEEFSTEESEEEVDNREYTVGAHFQVSHPSSYHTSREENPVKSYSFTNFHTAEKKYKEPPTRTYKEKISKKPIFKPSRPYTPSEDTETSRTSISDLADYYELPKGIDQDPRDFRPNFKLQEVPNLYPLQKKYRDVASKGQIEKYLEDQQKIMDEAVELQLLNDPNPGARGKYHQFLKSKDDERIEKEYEEVLKKSPLIMLEPSSNSKNHQNHKYSSKRPLKKTPPKGLSSYRTARVPDSYHFAINY